MIGSAANNGQAMLAALRAGVPAKAAGDAVSGAFDIVVAGLGAAPGKDGAVAGDAAPVQPGPVAPAEPPPGVSLDPVAAAEVIRGLVAPPAPPPSVALPVAERADAIVPPPPPSIAMPSPVPAVSVAAPSSAEPVREPPAVVIAGPIPALPPAAAAAVEGVVPAPMRPAMIDAGAEPEAGIANVDDKDGPQPDGMHDAAPENAGADPVAVAAPTIVYAPWLAPIPRPAPLRLMDAAPADPAPLPPATSVVASPVVSLPLSSSVPPSARAFVATELFATPAEALRSAAAQPHVTWAAEVDAAFASVPVTPRFTPLVPSSSPAFTPLVAAAGIPPPLVVSPDDSKAVEDDLAQGLAAPAADQAIDTGLPPAANVPPLPTMQGSAPPTIVAIAGPDVVQVVAGHQLDLARDSVWLDQLARDIVAAGANDAKLSFKLNPEHLGSLHVEVMRGDDGASVRMTTDNESARAALADAQGRLVAEARAHGMKIAETHVDLSQQGGGHGQRGGADGQSGTPNPQPQPALVNIPVTMIALDDETADTRTGPRERYA